MGKVLSDQEAQLLQAVEELASATTLRQEKLSTLLSKVDALSRHAEGLAFLYEHVEEILNAGVFMDTNWQHPKKLVPTLVKGTLCAGSPLVVYESLSELRMLRVALGEWKLSNFSAKQAEHFLQEAIVASFSLVFDDGSEESRVNLSRSERKRLNLLFDFILSKISLESLRGKLAREVATNAAQRPIKTDTLEQILKLVKDNMQLTGEDEDQLILMHHVDALFHPTVRSKKSSLEEYEQFVSKADRSTLSEEGGQMGKAMNSTGLVSPFQVLLVKEQARRYPEQLTQTLHLSSHGVADLERHQAFVGEMIERFVFVENNQVLYGLANMLNRNLLSRKALWNAVNKLFRIELNPDVAALLNKSRADNEGISAAQWLCGGMISMLGQPLGIGQGLNPTCQSARGLSMWSLHSPEKLINMTVNAATQNQLKFRYEGELVTSVPVTDEGKFDFNLDPVSLVLVPHLDSVYQQMMQKAMLKHPGEDPHVSVNPAFYGHWIQTGFVSCYKPLLNAIQDYARFVKLFYAAFHPGHNGGYNLVYPIPLGIFITGSDGRFLGFHAVSLLRVKQDQKGVWRAYFFNPNNEGRQNWGQGINPSVSEHGEKHGESSLPFYQFVSRVYAFHFNSMEADAHIDTVSNNDVSKVQKLAKQSWGQQYIWL